ncbi:MAG: hypothetical protein WA049_07985 [Ferribacterium limneticum]
MPDAPYHPIVADLLACLDEAQREQFEERAGILEFDAGNDRQLAEALALLEIIRRHGWPPTQLK